MKLFKCPKCGKVIEVLTDGNSTVICCNEKMIELKPNTIDAATEKHVPVYSVNDDRVYVKVGEVTHPMDENHYISMIICETKERYTRINLNPGDVPEAVFDYEEGMKIYAYCNLHGLWMVEINK